jgi:hypothetical protein
LRNAFYYDVLLLSAKGNEKARFNIALRTRGWGNAGGNNLPTVFNKRRLFR